MQHNYSQKIQITLLNTHRMTLLLLPLSFLFIIIIIKKSILENFKFGAYILIPTASVILSIIIFLFTEISSAFNEFSSDTSKIFWLAITVLSGILSFKKWKEITQAYSFIITAIAGLKQWIKSCLIVFITINFIVIYIAPPNNTDSHDYHLSRIVSWIQNKNVETFPTVFTQQLYHNVFGEYVIAQVLLFSDSDVWVEIIQFWAFISSLSLIVFISKSLGFSKSQSIYTFLFVTTLPIGILESTTTQVDYIACFFYLYFLAFVVHYKSTQELNNWQLTLMLSGLILCLFSKYIIYFYALPVIL